MKSTWKILAFPALIRPQEQASAHQIVAAEDDGDGRIHRGLGKRSPARIHDLPRKEEVTGEAIPGWRELAACSEQGTRVEYRSVGRGRKPVEEPAGIIRSNGA